MEKSGGNICEFGIDYKEVYSSNIQPHTSRLLSVREKWVECKAKKGVQMEKVMMVWGSRVLTKIQRGVALKWDIQRNLPEKLLLLGKWI